MFAICRQEQKYCLGVIIHDFVERAKQKKTQTVCAETRRGPSKTKIRLFEFEKILL